MFEERSREFQYWDTQQYMQSMSRYIFMYRNVYAFEMVNSLERATSIYLFAVVLDVALLVLCLHVANFKRYLVVPCAFYDIMYYSLLEALRVCTR